jgi:hypothetical protein
MTIIARCIVEIRIGASGEEYSVCRMKPCVERILRERYIPKANRSWAHALYAEPNSGSVSDATRDFPSCMGTFLRLRDKAQVLPVLCFRSAGCTEPVQHKTDAAAKAGQKGVDYSGAVEVAPGVWVYRITKNGLAFQLTLQGTKYYKDDDLSKALCGSRSASRTSGVQGGNDGG